MTLDQLNNLPPNAAPVELEKCCGSRWWVGEMMKRRPFSTLEELCAIADEVWWKLASEDWKEAFLHHPKIGGVESLKRKFAATQHWAESEQASVNEASDEILNQLAEGNRLYEEKFGYIFIVCATGKSAAEMLTLLNKRLKNDSELEIKIAAKEQALITRIRLEKMLQ